MLAAGETDCPAQIAESALTETCGTLCAVTVRSNWKLPQELVSVSLTTYVPGDENWNCGETLEAFVPPAKLHDPEVGEQVLPLKITDQLRVTLQVFAVVEVLVVCAVNGMQPVF